MKFIMFLDVKMPTIVHIYVHDKYNINTIIIITFVCMINTIYESLKARQLFTFQQFIFNETFDIHAQ